MTRKLLLIAGLAVAVCASAFLWSLSPRMSALPLFVVLLFALGSFSRHRRKSIVIAIWGLYLMALLLPIDIGFDSRAGFSPRLVRALYGLPAAEALDLAAKGEVWLGGCFVSSNDPKWMLLF